MIERFVLLMQFSSKTVLILQHLQSWHNHGLKHHYSSLFYIVTHALTLITKLMTTNCV